MAKGLADTEEISVTDWVSQMREKDKEKQQAEKRVSTCSRERGERERGEGREGKRERMKESVNINK